MDVEASQEMAKTIITQLHYRIEMVSGMTYRDPPPVEVEADEIRLRLADGRLDCTFTTEIGTVKEAQQLVEPILRAWEASSDLCGQRGQLRFKFVGAKTREGHPVIRPVQAVAWGVSAGMGTVNLRFSCYPPPPGSFRLTPDVEILLYRLNMHLDGREPLMCVP